VVTVFQIILDSSEIAHQLKAQGQQIGLLALIEPTTPGLDYEEKRKRKAKSLAADADKAAVGANLIEKLKQDGPKEKVHRLVNGIWNRLGKKTGLEPFILNIICPICFSMGVIVPKDMNLAYRNTRFKAISKYYKVKPLQGRAVLFRRDIEGNSPQTYWRKHIDGPFEIKDLPLCNHADIFEKPQVDTFVKKLIESLESP